MPKILHIKYMYEKNWKGSYIKKFKIFDCERMTDDDGRSTI